ncbi:MAG TPA: winged helix-turn-helix domain-containing protein [Hyphomonadaceae bacterium]|jgi:TolB-like protein/DNA-binding winged helix-turn-helix (wHTH) protein/tetratricopeptide (TPR) repeat protein|nr:winged helix-turn-helix domain-containing protein [Hyphomonadaceae bacterium]
MDLSSEPKLRLGRIDVSPATREVTFPGGRDVIEPRVMEVLITLARARGEVLSRDALIEACWDGRAVSDDAINRVISRVRKVSELTHGEDFILETIAKVGYRLVVKEVSPAAATEAAASVAGPVAAPAGTVAGAVAGVVAGGWLKGRMAWLAAGAVALVVAMLVGAFLLPKSGTAPAAAMARTADADDALTLAVMPFDTLSANSGDDLLAKGMSREIRNTLSRVRGLRVMADASSLAAAVGKMSATDLGEKQWADLVINGSFTRTGETVKLTAELVDAKTGLNVWAGNKSGPVADLDRLRELMSGALFQEIVARVGPNRLEQLAPPQPTDPRAYRLTLEAYQISSSLNSIGQRGAQEEMLDAGDRADALLDQALAIEPDNAEALMLKGILQQGGRTHAVLKNGATLQDRMARAADFFRRSLAVDPDNAEALVNLAEHYRRNEWRWAEARPLFERALAVDPNNVYALGYWSNYLSGAGRCIEALEQVRLLKQLNPVDWSGLNEARILKCLGRHEASDKVYLRTIEADRANLFVLSEYYLALLARRDVKGLRDLARHDRDDLWGGQPSAPVTEWLARISEAADALEGRPDTFVRRLDGDLRAFESRTPDQNGRRGSDRYWTFALEYAHAGETSRAIDLLGRALKEGSLYIPDNMPYGEWEFTPEMRKDPRYQALWKSDPRLVELMRLRLEALKARQFTGVMPDGTHVEALPVKEAETGGG